MVAGAAMADASKPILPGADITSKDLPNGPKPLEALKGDAGSKVQAILVSKLLPELIKHLVKLNIDESTVITAQCVAWVYMCQETM